MNCGKAFTVQYSCGPDPTVKTTTIAAEADGKTASLSCPTPSTPYSRKACVPTQCTGRQRRNDNLECVADLTRTTLPPFTAVKLVATQVASGANSDSLIEDTAYTVRVGVGFGEDLSASLPYDKEVTDAVLWAYDTFEKKTNSAETVIGYRCSLGDIGLRRPGSSDVVRGAVGLGGTAASRVLVGETANTVLPPACFGVKIASWRDAAKRLGLNEADFRTQYTMRAATKLAISLDPQGRTVALRTSDTTADAALVPNPVGFFYDPAKLWVNLYEYYRQTEAPAALFPEKATSFSDSTAILLSATKAMVRNPEQSVSLYDTSALPVFELDFTWTKQGDAPGRNPFSPTDTPLVSNVQTLTQRNLSATVEIAWADKYDSARQSNGWVAADQSMTLGTYRGTVLDKGDASGRTVRINAYVPEAVRDRIFREATNNNGWMAYFGQPNTWFRVRVCLDIDGRDRSSGNNNEGSPFTASRGSLTYTAGFASGKRCTISEQIVIINRWFEKAPFPAARSSTDGAAGRGQSQGDSTVGSNGDLGSQSACARACTVNADCGAGQTCASGTCSSSGPVTRCSTTDRNSLGAIGSLGISLFTTTTTSSNQQLAASTKSTVATRSEALSFTVLDSGEDEDKEEPWEISHPLKKWTLEFSPNWDLLAAILTGETLASQAAPVSPKFKAQETSKGMQGLGVGVGKDIYWGIGPIPLILSFSAGVGLGVGVRLEIEANPQPNYPCIGTSKCFRTSTTAVTMREAYASCLNDGGRLAEIVTANDLAGVQSAIGTDFREFWIGGQLGYKYKAASCATTITDDCVNNSTTMYRWISSANGIADQTGRGNTPLNTSSYTNYHPFSATQLSSLTTSNPSEAGLTYSKADDRVYGRPLTWFIYIPTKYKYVCEFAPAAGGTTNKLGVGLVIGAAAGLNASVCTPSPQIGFCLALGVNFISLEFSFMRTNWRTSLYDSSYRPMLTQGKDAFDIDYQGWLLVGSIAVELKMLFFTTRWEIFSANFGSLGKKNLYHHDYPVWRTYP